MNTSATKTIPITNYHRPVGETTIEQCYVSDESFDLFYKHKLVISCEWCGTFAAVYMRRADQSEEDELTFINHDTQIMEFIDSKIKETK